MSCDSRKSRIEKQWVCWKVYVQTDTAFTQRMKRKWWQNCFSIHFSELDAIAMSVTSCKLCNPKCYLAIQTGNQDEGTTLSSIVKYFHLILPFVLAHKHTHTHIQIHVQKAPVLRTYLSNDLVHVVKISPFDTANWSTCQWMFSSLGNHICPLISPHNTPSIRHCIA